MTHPLTPREKVAKEIVDRTGVGTLGLTYEASQSVALGIADAILTALASGSGDHAELARLGDRNVELSVLAYKWMEAHDALKSGQPYDYPSPADVPTLLAENAALRANEKAALKECSEWARKAGEAIGRLETSEAAGIVEGWRARATEAERKLDEAVGLLEDLSSWFTVHPGRGRVWRVPSGDLGADDAVNAARIFLSKEAERG